MKAKFAGTCKCGCGTRFGPGAEIVKDKKGWVLEEHGTITVQVETIGGNGATVGMKVPAHVRRNPYLYDRGPKIPGWGWGAADLDAMAHHPPQPCPNCYAEGKHSLTYYRPTCGTYGCPECGERFAPWDLPRLMAEAREKLAKKEVQ